MIASFTLAFAYLYWQRIAGQATPERQSVVIATSRAAVAQSRKIPRSMPAFSLNVAVSQEKSQVRAVPAAEVMPPVSADDAPLPVLFGVATKPVVINDDEGPSRREIQPDGVLLNSSDKRIALTVVEVNLPTMETTQAQLVLQPNGAMHFGRDRGLKMVSGDQLTLRATGYQELTKTVP
jgi:hypothetical protein